MKRFVKFTAPLSALLLLLPAGCGDPDSPPPQQQRNDPMAMFQTQPARPAADSGQPADSGPDMQQLNEVLRAYVRARKRIPDDMNELVSSGFISRLPPPPPGKRFAIIRHPLGYQVILVNQ